MKEALPINSDNYAEKLKSLFLSSLNSLKKDINLIINLLYMLKDLKIFQIHKKLNY